MHLLPFLLIMSLINSCIELEISAPGFPAIGYYFNVDEGVVGMTLTYNLFAFCLASIIYGPLSEVYGRRKIMIIGNFILVVGAAGCVFASTINMLLLSRFVQGIGAATSAVVSSSMISDRYDTTKAASLYGIMNSIFSILTAISPTLGAFINNSIGWRGNYGVVALIALISWILLYFLLPETKDTRSSLDIKAICKDYFRLLSSPEFVAASLVPSLLYAAYLAFISYATFLYMEAFGLDIITYALHQTFIVLAFSPISFMSGKIIGKIGEKNCLILGLFFISAGSILMLIIGGGSPVIITACESLGSIGFALIYPIVFAYSLEIFPEIKGTASSAIQAMRYLLCGSLVAIATYLYDGSSFNIALVIFLTNIVIVILSVYLMNKKIV